MPPLDAPHILSALWRASWQAGVLCLLVLLLRWTLRDQLPPAWRGKLWGLVFLRLLLPAVPASPLSLYNVVPADPGQVWPTLTVVAHATADLPPIAAATETVVPTEPADRPFPWADVLLATWLGGAAALAAATLVAHARFARRVGRSSYRTPAGLLDRWRALGGRPPVVVTDAVASPALFGLARGRLLLPPDLTARLSPPEVDLVFRHELAHVRRWDLAIGWAAVLIRCGYWFHPLVWAAVTARRADAEAACDDAVVAATGDRPAYGRVLLAVAGGGQRIPAIGMADGRTDLRRRLARIVADRRVGWRSSVAAAVLTAAVGCAALTGSDRPANVTRTYPNFWPPDCNPTPAVDAKGNTTTTAAPPSPYWTLPDMIRRNVTPDAWGHHGIDVHADGRLAVVTAPPDTQAAIERMIAEKSVQVSIETRVLTLRPSQVRAAGLAVPDVGVVGPIPATGVDALIRAQEADPTARQLTAPRLTLFNGQKAVLWVETQQAYVSSLTPVVAPGAALFDPVVSTVPAVGLRLSVHVAVSPDHRSGDMAAHVELTRLLALDPAVMTCTVGMTTIQGTMQMPRQWKMAVDADVTVPSGGSAWVRGQPTETYGSSTRPTAVTQPAEADAAETFVLWHVVVLRPRPTTAPATRPMVTVGSPPAPARPDRPVKQPGRYRRLANDPDVLVPAGTRNDYVASGLSYGAIRQPLIVPALPVPGTPTPDGRGVAERLSTTWRPDATVLLPDASATAGSPRPADIWETPGPSTRPTR